MRQQVVGSAVQGFFRHNVVARVRQILQGVAYCSRAACRGQCGYATFKGGYALFKGILRGIGKAAVYVARVAEVKAGLSVRTVVKYK